MSTAATQPRSRRGLVILLCAAAAAVLTWSSGAVWVTFADPDPAALAAPMRVTGRAVSGFLAVVPLTAAVLCIAAVISSRLWVRVAAVVAGLTAAGALGHAAARLVPSGALQALHPGLAVGEASAARFHMPGIAAGAIGLVLLLAASMTAARDVLNWPRMSSRYQRASQGLSEPTAQSAAVNGAAPSSSHDPLDPAAAWAALDAGDDPTADTAAG